MRWIDDPWLRHRQGTNTNAQMSPRHPMLDSNSGEIAELMLKWSREKDPDRAEKEVKEAC